MNLMKKKLNKKGFTLAELLVVVAIIAVLVAIAIPVFGSTLTKAKAAADLANVRACYAEELVTKMTEADYGKGNPEIEISLGTLQGAATNNTTVTHTTDADGKTLAAEGTKGGYIFVGTAGSFAIDGDVKIIK